MAYKAYLNPELDIHYWRTATGQEVDVILGKMDLAIEIKSSSRVHSGLMRALRSLKAEYKVRKSVIVCTETEPRCIEDDIYLLPWRDFINRLWADAFEL